MPSRIWAPCSSISQPQGQVDAILSVAMPFFPIPSLQVSRAKEGFSMLPPAYQRILFLLQNDWKIYLQIAQYGAIAFAVGLSLLFGTAIFRACSLTEFDALL